MNKLTPNDLYSLEEYSRNRQEYRARVMAHKKNRRVDIGKHATLYFEDSMTMQYQIQEMLRIEKIFEQKGIQEELDVYNPLIPDGMNWKATFMLEYGEENERKAALAKLIGIERTLWIQVDDLEKVIPISNEDLDRETEEKTSSVHFVRFELSSEMVVAAKQGAQIKCGIDHSEYHYETIVPGNVRDSLVQDLQ
jgi:hypothetical protein